MTTTLKLSDTHIAILAHAATSSSHAVLPLPPSVGDNSRVTSRLLNTLIRRGLIAEIDADATDMEEGRGAEDSSRPTLVITSAGLAAIGIAERATPECEAEQTVAEDGSEAVGSTAEPASDLSAGPGAESDGATVALDGDAPGAPFRDGTKGATLVDLLRDAPGASLPELMAASGWQAHSVRGFLSGALGKKHGLAVARETGEDGVRRYRLAG